ncbi:MAG: YigZ family protein [Lachnospiraceae bacterium]|nr:YigZ family protein [Lachnospiraceae bacterium]
MSQELIYEVSREGRGEYEEKKSRFIAVVKKVHSEDEANAFIAAKKKEHHDARHNCSAYIVTGEGGRKITRFSDDGEPAKTAGQPILEVLSHANLINVVCVVTRYFGGVLLGTGGLVRAYTQSAKDAVEDARPLLRRRGFALVIVTDYNDLGKVEYILREKGIGLADTIYEAKVSISCDVPAEDKDALERQITEQTAGRAVITWGDEKYI